MDFKEVATSSLINTSGAQENYERGKVTTIYETAPSKEEWKSLEFRVMCGGKTLFSQRNEQWEENFVDKELN